MAAAGALITVVRDKKGDGHAVLTVKTDKGEFILDNQNEDVLLWSETGYRFVKRQSQSDPECLGGARRSAARRPPPRRRAERLNEQRSYAAPVTSPPLPVPRPGSRAAGSPPRGRPHLFRDGASASIISIRLRPFAYCCQRRT